MPSLYRHKNTIGEVSQELFDGIERNSVGEFFSKAIAFHSGERRGALRDLVVAQHYGVATRLLDWTFDPLVALFFAVQDDNSENDASLYVIGPSLGGGGPEPNSIDRTRLISQFRPHAIDPRITAQKSVFTMQSYGESEGGFEPLDDRDWSSSSQKPGLPHLPWINRFSKIRIPKESKYSLLGDLLSFGVDWSALFPGLEGIGRDTAMRSKRKNYGMGQYRPNHPSSTPR